MAIIAVLLLVAFPSGHGQTQTQVMTNVTYCSPGGVNLQMDLYLPTDTNVPSPIVVYVHGGAWVSGNKSEQWVAAIYPLLNAEGIGLASINYRLAPQYKFPAQIQDVSCSVRFLRANAVRYNINPSEIGAFGDSAGGQLALLLGLTHGAMQWGGDGQWSGYSSNVQAIVDWFGPTDLTAHNDFAWEVNTAIAQTFGSSSSQLKAASPINYVTASAPPTLVEHGLNDSIVSINQSTELVQRLSPTSNFVEIDNAGHSWVQVGQTPISPSIPQIEQDAANWFATHL
jgi:acetyl esterase/lipase